MENTQKPKPQFIKDLDEYFNFNGNPMSRGFYNLVISIRDFKLYEKGLKPFGGWKPTAAREYFGIKPRESTKNTIILLEGWRDILTTEINEQG